MTVRIDRRLHLIVPIYKDEEGGEIIAHVHSTPLSEELVDRYFMTLGETYGRMFSQGLGIVGGPGHALRVLRAVAIERGAWADDPKSGALGIEHGLVEEIRRLTMVVAKDKEGRWEQLPLQIAADRGIIDSEDKAEVENAIAFFIVASATLSRAQRRGILEAAAGLWGAQISSLDFTAFCNSLKMSTATASSGEKSPAAASEKPARANATVGRKPASVPL